MPALRIRSPLAIPSTFPSLFCTVQVAAKLGRFEVIPLDTLTRASWS
jgi:hypothetical protein